MESDPTVIKNVDPIDDDPSGWTPADTIGAVILGVLFLTALIAPIIAWQLWGIWIGVISGVGIPIAWIMILPNSCMNGGLTFSLLAIAQSGAALIWLIVGVVSGIMLLF